MSEEPREEERAQEREADSEAETRPLDARDWEETRGEQEQEEKPRGTGEMTH